jgi:tetratricopeptide (TPR) repeat protein
VACPYESSARRYLTGGLAQAERTDFEAHLPGCVACARTVAASLGSAPDAPPTAPASDPPPAPGTFARGTTVGRYIILSLLGRGGMGEVYSAYDPRLDRKVALKLLREAPGGEPTARAAQERLLREAQSTARLAHRNVVVVYDAGTIEDRSGAGRVYLAMELVDGRTLAAWLAERRRSWREIRDVFVAAAEGLQAAHAAGLVHRDFKPQNVMVGRDGTVRVMDFGLAGDGSEGVAGEEPAIDLTSGEVPTAQTIALTHTGVLLGTPLYMAPEQFLGRKTDARTDQFSFCVALYEALYGKRPFPSSSLPELVHAVSTGQVRVAPKRTPVPAFLRRLLLKGLQANPDLRFESMRELTTALHADPLRHRRSVAIGAAVFVALLATAVGAQRAATRGQRMCRGAAEKLQAIWELDENGARRTAVHRAFVASGSPIADDTWTRVARLLDDYLRRWMTAYTDACEATHVRGDQSGEVLDLRMSCLDSDRVALRALTDIFARADTRALAEGVNAVNALPPIERCADIPELRVGIQLPTDRLKRARIADLQSRLAEVKALTDTGQWTKAYENVTPVVEAARVIDYAPLLAEALEARGWLAIKLSDITTSTRSYEESVWLALAARRDDLATEAAAQLIATNLYDRDGLSEVPSWELLAGALVRRLGPGHERIASWFHENRSIALMMRGDFDEAVREVSLAVSLKRKALPPNHPDLGISVSQVAAIDAYLGNGREALPRAQEAFEIFRSAYGSRSPILCGALDGRGAALRVLGRFEDSEKDLRSSVALATELYGPEHMLLADPLTELGRTLVAEGKYREAVPVLTSAVRLLERMNLSSPTLADARFPLAQARWALGDDRPAARALAVTALDTYKTLPGYKRWADKVEAWLADKPKRKGRVRP